MTARRQPIIQNDPPLSEAEKAHIRALIEPQLVALKAGTLETFDLNEAFDEVEKEIFG